MFTNPAFYLMKLAILGTRGIPANYGGFETFAEALSVRLVQRGHDVTVYCRSHNSNYVARDYKGVRLVVLPTIRHKYFDTVAHTFLSAVHSLKEGYDAVLICNSANSYISFLPRLVGTKVALNVDGLEWQRAKWNKLGKLFYRFSEWLATFMPDAIVSDARMIQRYYLKKFQKKSFFIPYGFRPEVDKGRDVLKKFGLEPQRYVLYVSRLEPENNAHRVIEAFEKVKTNLKLVVVGDAPYNQEYIASLKSTKDPRIVFTGYVFGKGYHQLQSNAYFYVQATEVGGTHPALVEAMGFGNCILANDVPEHREVLDDTGIFFRVHQVSDLAEKMQFLLDHPEVIDIYRQKARKRAEGNYSWDAVTRAYEKLFLTMLRRIR